MLLTDGSVQRIELVCTMITSFGARAKKEKKEKEEKEAFITNGSILLEKLVAFCNGRCYPIRRYSAEELERATKNFDKQQLIKEYGYFNLYKGVSQGRKIMIKKFIVRKIDEHMAFDEIVYTSQLWPHRNILKLLGCCLETRYPILVFEYVEDKTLADVILDRNEEYFRAISWKFRLKIVSDIANAVVYLHTALPRPIVHRNIKSSSIFLDENCVAKLSDFSISLCIPEGETYVQDIAKGTIGLIAPESVLTGIVTEKTDVFSFGVFLLVVLTGQAAFDFHRQEKGEQFLLVNHFKEQIHKNRFGDMVDPVITAEGQWPGKEQQLQAFAALAFRCASPSAADRPTMIEVAKELRHMYKSFST